MDLICASDILKNSLAEDITKNEIFSSTNSISNDERIDLLKSLNFAFYNFYDTYYDIKFSEECKINSDLIKSNSKYVTEENFHIIARKIQSKYLCSFSIRHSSDLSKKAKMYIEHKIKENISLDSISSFFHLNKVYFCTKFKQETGIGFMDYVQKTRINKAKILLSNRFLSVEEISQECGFSSAGYFSSVFKKMEGVSPTKFRKEHSNLILA